jgi:hypothetical protein
MNSVIVQTKINITRNGQAQQGMTLGEEYAWMSVIT